MPTERPQPCVIACSRVWRPDLAERVGRMTGTTCHLIRERDALTATHLEALAPRWVFLPHWSHWVPAEVYERFSCVVFHMTDVPFGRGGSPLQNLIARGIYETKVSALRCVQELDAGDVYLKAPLSLHGNAEEIYLRATDLIEGMIVRLIRDAPAPEPQAGEPVVFKRRRPAESDLTGRRTLREAYDWIRMLDAEGYPKAFVEHGAFRFEFSRSALQGDSVVADVRITALEVVRHHAQMRERSGGDDDEQDAERRGGGSPPR